MGAQSFMQRARGKDATDAFNHAVGEAQWEYGYGGYTGSMAEKDCYVEIALPEGVDPEEYADELISNRDPRIDDKWGPAGCFALPDGDYFFFGWASS